MRCCRVEHVPDLPAVFSQSGDLRVQPAVGLHERCRLRVTTAAMTLLPARPEITWPFHRSLEAASSRPIKNSARDGETILRWRKSHMILFPVAQSSAWQES